MAELKIPSTRDYQYGYDLAYRLARERLGEIGSLEDQCLRCGARCEGGSAVLDYLNQPCRISFSDREVSLAGGEIKIRDKILVLHYFLQAKGTPASNKLIAYKEIPGAVNYYATFYKRAIKPLVDNFGAEPAQLIEAAQAFGGTPAAHGDLSVVVPGFVRVPLTLVLWRGDAEFPPGANILFDSNITDYLALEDINVLSETAAWRLVRHRKH